MTFHIGKLHFEIYWDSIPIPDHDPRKIFKKDKALLRRLVSYGAILHTGNDQFYTYSRSMCSHKIVAIKKLRELTGCGLREAKDYVEELILDVCKEGEAIPEGIRIPAELFQWAAVF